jgi:hypothetical protein
MALSEKDFRPPGWLVTHCDKTVKLDHERAQKFHDFRVRLCEKLGKDNDLCNPTNLWCKALDLLLEHESELHEEHRT